MPAARSSRQPKAGITKSKSTTEPSSISPHLQTSGISSKKLAYLGESPRTAQASPLACRLPRGRGGGCSPLGKEARNGLRGRGVINSSVHSCSSVECDCDCDPVDDSEETEPRRLFEPMRVSSSGGMMWVVIVQVFIDDGRLSRRSMSDLRSGVRRLGGLAS